MKGKNEKQLSPKMKIKFVKQIDKLNTKWDKKYPNK